MKITIVFTLCAFLAFFSASTSLANANCKRYYPFVNGIPSAPQYAAVDFDLFFQLYETDLRSELDDNGEAYDCGSDEKFDCLASLSFSDGISIHLGTINETVDALHTSELQEINVLGRRNHLLISRLEDGTSFLAMTPIDEGKSFSVLLLFPEKAGDPMPSLLTFPALLRTVSAKVCNDV